MSYQRCLAVDHKEKDVKCNHGLPQRLLARTLHHVSDMHAVRH